MAICYPFRPCGQITTPMVYDESLSVAQQIALLFGRLHELDNAYVSTADFNRLIADFNDDQDSQTAALKSYTDSEVDALNTSLRREIDCLVMGLAIWDVTHGTYERNSTTMTRLLNDVTVHAITVDQLADLPLTVDSLADCGLNVRGLAVFSGYLMGEDFAPHGITYEGEPLPDNALTCKILSTGIVQDGYFKQGDDA